MVDPKFDNLSIYDLEKLDNLSKSSLTYNIVLGRKYLGIGNWSQANEYLSKSLEINPNSVEAMKFSLEILELNGEYKAAIILCEKIKGIIDESWIYTKIASLHIKNGDYNFALLEIKEGLAIYPNEETLLVEYCRVLELTSRLIECEDVYQRLIELKGKNILYYLFDYAVFLRNAGNHIKSKAILNELKTHSNELPTEIMDEITRFISEQNVEKSQFKVAARLLMQLGEQMIENEVVALSELIKNSYDARSKFVSIRVDTEYEERGKKIGKIIIEDTGIGMTKEVINKHWLMISTSKKLNEKKNGLEDKIPLGEKGIGRLSAHRLGHKLVVETKVKNAMHKTYLEVDWEKFEYQSEAPIDNINLIVSESEDLTEKQYTVITITKLRNSDFWKQLVIDSSKKYELQKELFSMISPFKGLQEAFNLGITINGEDLKIESIDEEFLETISSTKLEFVFNLNNDIGEWELNGQSILYPEFYNQKTKKHITDLKGYDNKKWLELYLNEVKIPDEAVVFPFNLSQQEISKRLKDLWETNLFGFLSPGQFKMVVYGFSRDSNIKERVQSKLAEIFGINSKKVSTTKKYFDSIKGIKIYRDGFRVFPYGDGKSVDWLGLDQSASTSGSYDNLKSSNTTGYIALTGKNENLREKTNREGFINDVFSTIFFRLCQLGIKLVNEQVSKELDEERKIFNELTNLANIEIQEIKAKKEFEIKILEQKLLESTKIETTTKVGIADLNSNVNVVTNALNLRDKVIEHVEATHEQNKVLKVKLENTLEDLERVTELASFGMLVEAFTHEFELQGAKLKKKVEDIIKLDAGPSSKKALFEIKTIVGVLDGFIRCLAPSYQKERNRKSKLDLVFLLKSMYSPDSISFIASRAKRNNIQINIFGSEKMHVFGNQGLLMQTFDNLYLNSEYWLNYDQQIGIVSTKAINICIDEGEKKVTVWDSGQGIDPNVEADLFNAFITTKPSGEGRGLGLYISKTILETMKVNIFLSQERNSFDRRFEFIIDFRKNGG